MTDVVWDRATAQEVIDRVLRQGPGRSRAASRMTPQTTWSFLALTGTGGIPARNGDEPGVEVCQIYRIQANNPPLVPDTLVPVVMNENDFFWDKVYNTSETSVPPNYFTPLIREAYGAFIAIPPGGTATKWYRVNSGEALLPGGSAEARLQKLDGSLYVDDLNSESEIQSDTVYDAADADGLHGQNCVLPNELVPVQQINGRLECVGSRGLIRDVVITEAGGIDFDSNGAAEIYIDGIQVDPIIELDVHYKWLNFQDNIPDTTKAEVIYKPHPGRWEFNDLECI